jgi:hypothetical protein
MKITQKIRRVQLKINRNDESVLIGIVSSEPDYKLSLALNRKLKIGLKHVSPIVLPDESGSEMTFSRFSDSVASGDKLFELISNRYGKNFLLRKLKNIDFIFQIHDPENETNIDQMMATLRDSECITAVFNIDFKSIKDKNLQYLAL